MNPTGVALLGSTGSIGEQALDVIRAAPGRFRVVALAAGRSADRLAAQARELRPAAVGLVDATQAAGLAAELPPGCRLAVGPEAVAQIHRTADVVVVVVGEQQTHDPFAGVGARAERLVEAGALVVVGTRGIHDR